MAASVVGTITSGAGKVGRYFTVVSALPAALLTTYACVIVQAGWSEHVRWSAIGDMPWYGVLLAGLFALALALALNPLQFPLIQLFEGYWGTSALGIALATLRTAHHRRRLFALKQSKQEANSRLEASGRHMLERRTAGSHLIRAAIVANETSREASSYPEARDILPTRLGNVLRRYERLAGRSYLIDPLAAVPRLAMVGSEQEVAYVQNQRVQLELALRTSLMAFLGTAVTLVVMSRHGFWLLLALVPYSVAYLAYRGAVALAHEYGTSLAVLVDLSRFELYRRMGLKQPGSTEEERQMNATLMKIFEFSADASLRYEDPPVTLDQALFNFSPAPKEEE
ncbi:hypothetical protein [Lentzea sp. NBRC 102530]|uniref:hypothetical protein n=1 Tax=Lentzea sp. NBRC 102530 TaxID=3032201 RepID=UPI0024A4BAA1|nr:hypothetical protein [Lentzea sp. NBRC 102530]GLY51212.1 hypothetical protein Lesp01_48680 [Lentzea sp. NBRC 102530]